MTLLLSPGDDASNDREEESSVDDKKAYAGLLRDMPLLSPSDTSDEREEEEESSVDDKTTYLGLLRDSPNFALYIASYVVTLGGEQ